MIRSCFEFGSKLAPIWFEFGSDLVRIWFGFRSELVQIRFEFGSDFVRIWLGFSLLVRWFELDFANFTLYNWNDNIVSVSPGAAAIGKLSNIANCTRQFELLNLGAFLFYHFV